MPIYNRILITGAAGRLGSQLRTGLAPLATTLRLADREPLTDRASNEEHAVFDLADMEATIAAAKDCDAIVHFGGAPNDKPWQEVLDSSIRGSYHVYEGARKYGVKRVIYASSVHAIGFHEIETQIDANSPVRPDTLYGVSKVFVESLGQLYWDKYGIETVCLRIFSCFPKPADHRMLWSWLSFDDCVRLVIASLTAPRVGHTISFGLSNNKMKTVDNRMANHLGYQPQDSSEPYREEVEASGPIGNAQKAAVRYLGGAFCEFPHPDDAPQ